MKLQRAVPILWIVLLTASTSGCAGGGFFGYLLTGKDAIPKKYALPDRTTLVLVDDPDHLLGGPSSANRVASNVAYYLKEGETKKAEEQGLPTAKIISIDEINALRADMGDKTWHLTPIDQLGKKLGADQVIYVRIDTATLGAINQKVYRPKATCTVKVIDAIHSTRLWPEVGTLIDSSQAPPGHAMRVNMQYDGTDRGGQGHESILVQELCESIGRDVARLFYDWKSKTVGSTIH